MNKIVLLGVLLCAVMYTYASDSLITRSYTVGPGIVEMAIPLEAYRQDTRNEDPEAECGKTGDDRFQPPSEDEEDAYIKEFFKEAGIAFPQGSSISYEEKQQKLVMRNTDENHSTLASILKLGGPIGHQVEVVVGLFRISRKKSSSLVKGKRMSAQRLASASDLGTPISLISGIGRSGITICANCNGNRLSARPTVAPDGRTIDIDLDVTISGSSTTKTVQTLAVLYDGETVILQASSDSDGTDLLTLTLNLVDPEGRTVDRKRFWAE